MQQSGKIFMIITVVLWGCLVGGIVYSHMAFLPGYLSHLPESRNLINDEYGVRDERFWKFIHPVLILSIFLALLSNWKLKARRNYILIASGIYLIALVVTFIYFVPELMMFAGKGPQESLTADEWLARGKRWELLSQTRGATLVIAYICIIIALTKEKIQNRIK